MNASRRGGLRGKGSLHDLLVAVELMTPGGFRQGGKLLVICRSAERDVRQESFLTVFVGRKIWRMASIEGDRTVRAAGQGVAMLPGDQFDRGGAVLFEFYQKKVLIGWEASPMEGGSGNEG